MVLALKSKQVVAHQVFEWSDSQMSIDLTGVGSLIIAIVATKRT